MLCQLCHLEGKTRHIAEENARFEDTPTVLTIEPATRVGNFGVVLDCVPCSDELVLNGANIRHRFRWRYHGENREISQGKPGIGWSGHRNGYFVHWPSNVGLSRLGVEGNIVDDGDELVA